MESYARYIVLDVFGRDFPIRPLYRLQYRPRCRPWSFVGIVRVSLPKSGGSIESLPSLISMTASSTTCEPSSPPDGQHDEVDLNNLPYQSRHNSRPESQGWRHHPDLRTLWGTFLRTLASLRLTTFGISSAED